jgi:triacylglycerol lipase
VQPCVVLLHGLGRTAFSMHALASDFRAAGFVVVNQGYPSRTQALPKLAEYVAVALKKCATRTPMGDVNFVTHSMGAIVLRQYFADAAKHGTVNATQFGRAVLLGPPNHGSEIVDTWGDRWWYRISLGPAGAALSTAPTSSPNTLPSLPIQFAVIAGDSARANWFLPRVSQPSDGKVSVASTRLSGMDVMQQVPVGHTWLPSNRAVRTLTLSYIQTGKFCAPNEQVSQGDTEK